MRNREIMWQELCVRRCLGMNECSERRVGEGSKDVMTDNSIQDYLITASYTMTCLENPCP